MSRLFRVLFVVALIAVFALTVLPAAAQLNEAACPTRPFAQVRFYDFDDIPAYIDSPDAIRTNGIFVGEIEATSIPSPNVRINGGERQKYLLCGAYDAEFGAVQVVVSNQVLWVPSMLVESVVPRNWRDSQAGSALSDYGG
jgi:hypothetical protein